VAEIKGVEIRTYQVIYDITDDLKKAAEGMLAPELRRTSWVTRGPAGVQGHQGRAVAGCYVTDGIVQRDALYPRHPQKRRRVVENDRRLAQLQAESRDGAKEGPLPVFLFFLWTCWHEDRRVRRHQGWGAPSSECYQNGGRVTADALRSTCRRLGRVYALGSSAISPVRTLHPWRRVPQGNKTARATFSR
jgi:hypothetical protein